MHLNGAALAGGIDALVRLSLHVDPIDGDSKAVREPRPHRELVRADLGALQNDGRVEIDHRPPLRVRTPYGLLKEHGGVLRLVAGIGVREELPDVRESERTQNRVRDGVEEGVPVGVGDRASIVGEPDPAQHKGLARAEGVSGFEPVEVVPVSDAEIGEGRSRGRTRRFRPRRSPR